MPNSYYDENEKTYKELYEKVMEFMIENEITCVETIGQCDWVIQNAYEFIEDLFKIVKHKLPIDDEE